MDMDITAAVLHLREASRLFQATHPELSLVLLKAVNAFTRTKEDAEAVQRMEAVSEEIIGTYDGSSD